MSDSRAGLVNPYALAELAVGRRVRWTSVTDHEAFVEKVLGASIEQLCAPVAGNPLVSGAADAQEALFSIREATTERGAAFRSHAEGGLTGAMLSRLSPPAQMRIISALAGGEKEAELEYTPAGAEWADAGDYFEEAAEFFDPVQGALGDCYFIAALSAVAWSRPYVIVLRERAIGHGQQDFVDRIDFYPAGSLTSIEVSERLPLVKALTRGSMRVPQKPARSGRPCTRRPMPSGRLTIRVMSPTTGRSREATR